MAEAEREDAWNELKEAEKKVEGLTAFQKELLVCQSTDESHILGHIIFSPCYVRGFRRNPDITKSEGTTYE